MYDPLTLDQLRAFVTVADEGSFSAAARKLQRVQSAVSTAMANLEAELAVPLWDRTGKLPKLTSEGHAVLTSARRVLSEVDALRTLTSGMNAGLEPSVSLCVDALFPLSALLDLCGAFAKEFPAVDLRIDTQLMSAVSARVLDGRATLGVASPRAHKPGLERRVLAPIRMIPVVSPSHPLAKHRGPIPDRRFADENQIVLSERSDEGVSDQGVLSARTWRVADLYTKHEMLRRGLGWGNLPEHLVREDLRARRLVRIRPASWGADEHTLYLSAIHRSDVSFGPAHRWIVEQLGTLCAEATAGPAGQRAPAPKREKRRP